MKKKTKSCLLFSQVMKFYGVTDQEIIALGWHKSTVSLWMSGDRTMSICDLLKLSKALGIDAREFIPAGVTTRKPK